MEHEIKKSLTSNWFKMLQESICQSITNLEKKNVKFRSTTWKRNQGRDEGGGEFKILENGDFEIGDFKLIEFRGNPQNPKKWIKS